MKTNNYCCRIFPILLLFVSILIGLGMWYFDEGVRSFSFLIDKNEVFNFIGTVLFIALLPIGIFYYAAEKEKYKDNAKKLALLGFLPTIVLLGFMLY